MQSNAIMEFELLKILIITPQYLASIMQNASTQTGFLNTLKISQYTPEQLLELISITLDNRTRSLLIIQLLSLKPYLERLPEQPLLERLTNNTQHIPSRLNQLIHQISIEHLTPDYIKALQPEAAISILCSPLHFHLLKKEQIAALIDQYPKPSLIQYWVNHYSLMPNAFFVFAHLSELIDMHIISAVEQLDLQKQEQLIHHAIEHLDLFSPTFKLLYEGDKEKHLIQAIKHYRYSNQHPHYISYIHRLISILLSSNTPLSLETIKLILSLNDVKELGELIKKNSDLINYYLRTQAHGGEIALFYNGTRLNSNILNLLVQLKKEDSVKTKERSFLYSWLHSTATKEPQEQSNGHAIPENPLIQQLAKKGKSIKAIDYYLLHFKGNSEDISKLVQDHLSYYLREGGTESRRQTLYLTAMLINRKELKRSVREALYTSLLLFPELYDEQIRSCLFKYSAGRTIKHFGHRGGEKNYQIVIEFCTEALKKLIPNKDDAQIKIATQALIEANQELEFNENTGFFSRLFHWLIRCWKCGWTGFFSPNLPEYVIPFYTQAQEQAPSSQETIMTADDPETAVMCVLDALEENKRTLPELDKLAELLSTIPLPMDVPSLRNRINHLFHELINEGIQNKKIESWLIKNKSLVEANQFHLLELQLQQSDQMSMEQLKEQIQQEPVHVETNKNDSPLQIILNELHRPLPELPAQIKTNEEAPKAIPDDVANLDRVSGMVYSAWKWAKGVGIFFAPQPPIPGESERARSTCSAISLPLG